MALPSLVSIRKVPELCAIPGMRSPASGLLCPVSFVWASPPPSWGYFAASQRGANRR